MAHYSSQLLYYEDGDKLPLKSTSMKPLVFALDAQFRVDAEDEEYWARCNGIYQPTHYSWRPIFVVSLYEHLLTDLLRNRIKPTMWRKL